MLTTWDRRRADVVDVALQAGFPQTDAEVLAVASRPAARLVARSDRAPELGASKLGGLPDLAPDAGWPRGRHGLMTFLGQVATAQVAFLDGIEGWRPAGALLSFFADKDPESDEVTAGVVLATDAVRVARRERPAELHARSLLRESAVDARPVMTPPMSFDVMSGIDLQYDLDADDWAAWERLYEGLQCGEATIGSGHHQLFRHAWVSGDMDPVWMGGVMLSDEDEDANDPDHPFRLLAQFTTDHDAGIELADAGGIYFVAHVDDLAAGRYDRLAVVMQSH